MFKKKSSLEGRFGMQPLFPSSQDQIQFLKEHYEEYLISDACKLDDQTWADIDMDRMFMELNASYSTAGDMMMYGMLRTPCLQAVQMKLRKDIIDWALHKEEERELVIPLLFDLGKRQEDMGKMMTRSYGNAKRKMISIALAILFLISIILAIMFPNPMVGFMIAIALCNMVRASFIHKRLQEDVNALVYILAHMDVLHALDKASFTGLTQLKQQIHRLSDELHNLKVGRSLDYFESSLRVTNLLFHTESITYDKFAQEIYEKRQLVTEAIALIGSIDACIAAASYIRFHKLNPDIELIEGNEKFIDAKQMVHPLLNDAVTNDVDLLENRIITGSNATGKSTFLKMIALNAVLAQSFHFVCAQSYRANYFQIATSMTIHDNLQAHESTYVAEVKSMMYLTKMESEIPTLCMIDEVLRGTNTQERIAASSVILKMLAQRNFRCICATHDVELTKILSDYYVDYHFSETMKDNHMVFDYKIHKGVSMTRNAIQLLSLLEYDSVLIQQAEERLQYFETVGEWKVIENMGGSL